MLKKALKNVTTENRLYFHYKFPDTRFDKTIAPKSKEDFLKIVNRKTFNGFLDWEKTPEYANLVALYLQSKMADDLYTIYDVVREKALKGDEKQIKLLLSLNKEINNMVKAGVALSESNSESEDDGLVL